MESSDLIFAHDATRLAFMLADRGHSSQERCNRAYLLPFPSEQISGSAILGPCDAGQGAATMAVRPNRLRPSGYGEKPLRRIRTPPCHLVLGNHSPWLSVPGQMHDQRAH